MPLKKFWAVLRRRLYFVGSVSQAGPFQGSDMLHSTSTREKPCFFGNWDGRHENEIEHLKRKSAANALA